MNTGQHPISASTSPATATLVVPTRMEMRVVRKALPQAVRNSSPEKKIWQTGEWLLVQSGMGPMNAVRTTTTLAAHSVTQIWLLGVCGGLVAGLAPGDLVIANQTIERTASGIINRIDHAIPNSNQSYIAARVARLCLKVHTGPIMSANSVLATRQAKREAAQTGAIAVEMEAAPLARWALSKSIPFVHLRVVMDPWDHNPLTGSRPWGFVRELFGFPALCHMLTARQSLYQVARGLFHSGSLPNSSLAGTSPS